MRFQRLCVILLALAAFAGIGPAKAQYADTTSIYLDYREKMEPFLRQQTPQEIQPLEHPIDPDTYIVGPGDVLVVSVWGMLDFSEEVPVLPEGTIVVPKVGVLDVKERTLTDIETLVGEKVTPLYPSADVTVAISRLRNITVHIVGEIFYPGNFTATPADRVSNIIKLAGGLNNWADGRHIRLERRNGNRVTFDYHNYMRNGDMTTNLEVQAGDVVVVPRHKFNNGTVYLEGNVSLPGHYPLYPDETLGSLLERTRVRRENTDWDNAYVKRAGDSGETAVTTIPLVLSASGSHAVLENFLLKSGDRAFLPKRIDQVYVTGAVREPGPYPYFPNYRAIDYMGMAGKMEYSVGPDRLKIVRRDTQETEYGGDVIIERGDIVEVALSRNRKFQNMMGIALPITSTITSIIIAIVAINK